MKGPQARLGDLHICTVPPGFPSPILPPCSPNVFVGKRPAARALADMAMTGSPPVPPVPHVFPMGSSTVMINYLQALRVGDMCDKGGRITMGEFTVITGG